MSIINQFESDGENQEASLENTLIFLAVNIKSYPEVLHKSQTPGIKQKKDIDLKKLVELYQENFGVPITVKQLMKKLNNMKTRLRKKTDKNQTGNQKIVLNQWEKILFTLLQGENNPTFGCIPGALQFGVLEPSNKLPETGIKQLLPSLGPSKRRESTNVDNHTSSPDHSIHSVQSSCSVVHSNLQVLFANEEKPAKKTKLHYKTDKYETPETRGHSTAELQRVVLLEQLAAARAQKEAALVQIEYFKNQNEVLTLNLD